MHESLAHTMGANFVWRLRSAGLDNHRGRLGWLQCACWFAVPSSPRSAQAEEGAGGWAPNAPFIEVCSVLGKKGRNVVGCG